MIVWVCDRCRCGMGTPDGLRGRPAEWTTMRQDRPARSWLLCQGCAVDVCEVLSGRWPAGPAATSEEVQEALQHASVGVGTGEPFKDGRERYVPNDAVRDMAASVLAAFDVRHQPQDPA